MFKPGISATAAHILHAMRDSNPAIRQAIAEEILTFADLEDEPAKEGFVEAFTGDDRRAQIRAANAMARNGILEPRDLDYFRFRGLQIHAERCSHASLSALTQRGLDLFEDGCKVIHCHTHIAGIDAALR